MQFEKITTTNARDAEGFRFAHTERTEVTFYSSLAIHFLLLLAGDALVANTRCKHRGLVISAVDFSFHYCSVHSLQRTLFPRAIDDYVPRIPVLNLTPTSALSSCDKLKCHQLRTRWKWRSQELRRSEQSHRRRDLPSETRPSLQIPVCIARTRPLSLINLIHFHPIMHPTDTTWPRYGSTALSERSKHSQSSNHFVE
jgi:hypothetical protein